MLLLKVLTRRCELQTCLGCLHTNCKLVPFSHALVSSHRESVKRHQLKQNTSIKPQAHVLVHLLYWSDASRVGAKKVNIERMCCVLSCQTAWRTYFISLIYINQGNILGCTKHVYSTLLPNSYLHHTRGSLVRPRSDHVLTIKELWSLFRTGQRPPPKSFIVAVLIWTLVQLEFNLTKYQYYSCDITRLWGKSCPQTTGIFKFKHGSGFLFK